MYNKFMAKRKVLVTGGAGFIGSHLVDRLMDRGEHVVVVVDNFNRFYSPKIKSANIASHLKQNNFFLHKLDIRDQNGLKEVFSKYRFDCVVHLAAMAGVRPSIEKPILYADVNLLGTINLLEQIRHFSVKRMVFASSSSVYGERSGPFRESDSTDEQVSPYGATKKAGELLCHTWAHLYGVQTTILRLFTVYGPRNRPDMACFKFLEALMKGRPIMRFGTGETGRDYTYIDDVIDGLVAAIDTPFNWEIINLGNSSPVKLNDLIKTIETVTGKKANINELPLQPGDVKLTFANISKARRLLSYSPTVTIKEGIDRLFSWYSDTFVK